MSKLLTTICLLAVSAFLMSGGCTPEANETWSESADLAWAFGDMIIYDWSGIYVVYSTLDYDFLTMTLFQTGNSLQGFDNYGRTWNGYITGSVGPVVVGSDLTPENTTGGGQMNMETSDGGTEVITTWAGLYEGTNKYFGGQHYTQTHAGIIEMIGPGITGGGGDDDDGDDDTTP